MLTAAQVPAHPPWRIAAVCLDAATLAATQPGFGPSPLQPRQVVFEVRYENHAWGDQFAGVYVDTKGRTYEYRLGASMCAPVGGDPRPPDALLE